jgi:hypothetical protein
LNTRTSIESTSAKAQRANAFCAADTNSTLGRCSQVWFARHIAGSQMSSRARAPCVRAADAAWRTRRCRRLWERLRRRQAATRSLSFARGHVAERAQCVENQSKCSCVRCVAATARI